MEYQSHWAAIDVFVIRHCSLLDDDDIHYENSPASTVLGVVPEEPHHRHSASYSHLSQQFRLQEPSSAHIQVGKARDELDRELISQIRDASPCHDPEYPRVEKCRTEGPS